MDIGCAQCRVKEAQSVLSMWLEVIRGTDDTQTNMIGALISLLDGVPQSMEEAEGALLDYEFPHHRSAS